MKLRKLFQFLLKIYLAHMYKHMKNPFNLDIFRQYGREQRKSDVQLPSSKVIKNEQPLFAATTFLEEIS